MFTLKYDYHHQSLMIKSLELYSNIYTFNLYPIFDVLKESYPHKKIEFANLDFFQKVKKYSQNCNCLPKLTDYTNALKDLSARIAQDTSINISQTDLGTLIRALDYYSRIIIGQLHETAFILRMSIIEFENIDEIIDFIEDGLTQIKFGIFNMPPNASHGIYNKEVPNDARIVYEIQQELRYANWKISDKKYPGVDSNPTFHKSGYPLIECYYVNE